MSWVATAIIGGSVIGAGANIWSSSKASQAQTNAANAAIGAQQGMFNTAQGYISPYATAGADVLPLLKRLLTPGPDQNAALSQTPGFAFNQYWGNKAAQNSLIGSRGLGGNVSTGLAQYSSGLAQNTWQNTVNNLLSLVSSGSGAAGSLGSLAANTGQGIANSLTGRGNAQAGADIGIGNAIGGVGSSLTSAALINQLMNRGGSPGGLYSGSNLPGQIPYYAPGTSLPYGAG
jgi:hypothetical protein